MGQKARQIYSQTFHLRCCSCAVRHEHSQPADQASAERRRADEDDSAAIFLFCLSFSPYLYQITQHSSWVRMAGRELPLEVFLFLKLLDVTWNVHSLPWFVHAPSVLIPKKESVASSPQQHNNKTETAPQGQWFE